MTPSPQRLHVASESVQGRRPYNEDSVLTESLADGRVLLAVADGMGGHAAGEVASALAVQVLRERLAAGGTLGDACREANRRVHAHARAEPGRQGMGTTLVAVLVEDAQFRVANVGDSRAYLITAEGIRQISEDHSFVAEAVRRGGAAEAARVSAWRDALTRSVGTDAEVEVDEFGPLPLPDGAALLLCSDGLYKALEDDRLEEIVATSSDPDHAARALAQVAYDAGSDDNITTVVAERGRLPRRAASAPPAPAATLRMEPLDTPEPVAPPEPARRPVVAKEAAPAAPPARPAAFGLAVAGALLAAAVLGWLVLRR